MTVLEVVLWPFSFLYGAATSWRGFCFRTGLRRQKRLNGIVVSVGNLTVGGTGKTPMVLWLAQRFSENGQKVGILCRGYRPMLKQFRGSAELPISNGWNDEMALLHSRLGKRVELGGGADRFKRGREIEEHGITKFILDDGFQHLQLARDVNILLIDASNPFGGGHLLPAGRLREPLSAIRRADIVVITRSEHSPDVESLVRIHSKAPIFYAQTELLGIVAFNRESGSDLGTKPREKSYFAFCGIGNPKAFFDDLDRWGISVAGRAVYRDHHSYTKLDLNDLESRASASGADSLLCTEKDVFKLMPFRIARIPLFFCRVALRFSDEEGLWDAISNEIRKKSPGAAQ